MRVTLCVIRCSATHSRTLEGTDDMGGLGDRQAVQQIPGDVAPMRSQNINLLNYILFGQQGAPGGGQSQNPFAAFGGAAGMGGMAASNPAFLGLLNRGQGGQPNPASWTPSSDPGQRLENVFGNLAPEGIKQFLNQPTPEQRALDTSMPALQEILSGNPSQNPMFQQDLSLANQQGSRFGSANEILRGQALTGLWNQRNAAAQTLGMLSGAAGQGQQRQAGMMDLETQRRLQLLMSLLGTSQSASFNLPWVTQPSTLDTLGQVVGVAASALGAGGGGGGGGGGASAQELAAKAAGG